MSRWQATRLVAGREITERLQGRLTKWMTIITALLVVAGIVLPGVIKSNSASTKVALVGPEAQSLAPALTRAGAAAKIKLAVSDVQDPASARARLKAGTLDVALAISNSSAQIYVKQSLPSTVRALLTATIDEVHLRATLLGAGVEQAVLRAALTPVPVSTRALEPTQSDKAARDVAAIAAGLLMYIALGLYGGAVANGVAQEKTSRTAEVLFAAVRPAQLLTGKVAGIGLTGLGQLAIAAAAGLIASLIVHTAKIPTSVLVLLPSFLVCFLAGFVLYAFAYAAAGALVARQEEVQFVATPIGMPLLIGYLLAYAAIGSPNATWLKVVSFLPPLTATVMPARIALGHVAPWELALAAVLMLLSIYGMVRLASRIYSRALISGGARLSWRQALRLT